MGASRVRATFGRFDFSKVDMVAPLEEIEKLTIYNILDQIHALVRY